MLELFHDFTSAASYVAVVRMQTLADEGVDVRFRGIDVRGLDATLPVSLDTLAELEHARREATDLGLVLVRPRVSPPTAAAHVVSELAAEHDLGAAWRIACYRAFWEQGLDLGDVDVLASIGQSCGLEADRVAACAADRVAVANHRRFTATLRGDGVGGVPVVRASGTLVPASLPDEDLRHLATL